MPVEPPNPLRSGAPKNQDLLELIRGKRERSWKPSIEELRSGFRGWHQRGYLPHFDAPGVSQMVTFMLADSFPVKRRSEWQPILEEPDASARRRKLETWLDRGHGECWLARAKVAQVVEQVLREGDGTDFGLRAWVLMPNHIHLVVDVWTLPLSGLIKKWKGRSAQMANEVIRRAGRFWQQDYYDTVIRDSGHLSRAIRYAEQNPVKAGLVLDSKSWGWGSAGLRNEFGRLQSSVPPPA
jgi:putative transposase